MGPVAQLADDGVVESHAAQPRKKVIIRSGPLRPASPCRKDSDGSIQSAPPETLIATESARIHGQGLTRDVPVVASLRVLNVWTVRASAA